MFQNYPLYPHLSVFENIAFPLRLQGKHSDEEIRKLVNDPADTLELQENLDRKPSQLSGGQRQRVAMGRAIVRQADAFLFDEPLSNLDAKLRGQMRTEILRLQRRLGVTTVYVTHDQTEAMTLGDRVAVLKKGVLQQVASPRELYEQPVNLFVAGFIGSPPMNFIPAVLRDGRLELPFASIPACPEWTNVVGEGQLFITGIRPGSFEDASLVDPGKAGRGITFDVTVDVTEWLGNEQYGPARGNWLSAAAARHARMGRSPELPCESGRPALGSSRPRLRTPASAGHPAQSSTGRDIYQSYVLPELWK